MAARYVDIPSIVQVIGCIYQNPYLLGREDEYFFNEDDFTEDFHKVLFGSIYNLYHLGAKEITINAIEDYLEQRPKKLAIYKANKGKEFLEKTSENIQMATFDYYYQKMKKMTLLRMYNEKCGMDLSWLYDINNLFDSKKKQSQEDWLDETSLEEIANLIDGKIEDIKLKYIDDANGESEQAGEGVIELLQNLKETPEIGYPLYGDLINTVTRGARLKKFYLRSSSTGVGKALPNSIVIPTPTGDKKIGDVKVGDYLFDGFGKPTLVKAIYPQGKKDVWQITFKDGRQAKCCDEHLWSYCTYGQSKKQKENRKFYTKTLKEINQLELYKKGSGYKIQIPMQQAVEYNSKNVSVPPYVLGLLLGDGSFRYTEQNKALTFSSEDEELVQNIAKEMQWIYKKNSKFNYSWSFEDPNDTTHINVWTKEVLKDYPKLWNCKSEDKFIPAEYLEGDIQQRLDLLNGLLDTDGTVDKEKGRVSYCTVSKQLKEDVLKLAQSLGFKTSWFKDTHKEKSLPLFIIRITGRPQDKIKLFKLKRKKDLIEKWFNNGKRKEENNFNPIIKIEKLNYQEEMTCFYVDNEEHLFLMNDFIVTHNTRTMIADACNFACSQIYNVDTKKWEDNGTKEPTIFISTEQELDELRTMMIAFVSGVNEEHIINGEYFAGEWDRVTKAASILKESELYIEQLPDFSLQDIENTIKKNIREHNVRYVCFDYIHTSMKILSEVSSKTGVKGLREDNILFMISIRLKDLCNEYGVFILTSTQLNADYVTADQYDQNLLRGAKAIADKIDVGLIMLEASADDKKALKEYCKQNNLSMPDVKMSVYKNRRGRYKNILLWCSADRGICRINPIFATDYQYNPVEVKNLKIKVKPNEEGMF